MSQKTIPQHTVFTCDACGRDISPGGIGTGTVPHKIGATLLFRGSLLDMHGDPVANGDWNKDFCDRCWLYISGTLEAAITSLKPLDPSCR